MDRPAYGDNVPDPDSDSYPGSYVDPQRKPDASGDGYADAVRYGDSHRDENRDAYNHPDGFAYRHPHRVRNTNS